MDRVLGALTAPLLPAWAAAVALHPRWRRDRAERLGWRIPPVQPGAVWVHASSVGEVGAAWALIEQLPDPVLLTADTDTGAARARALATARPGVAAGCKPVDHPLALAPLWAEARPRLVVFVEGTFWPALAWRARRDGVPVVRVSAKIGPRTTRFGRLLRPWWWPVDAVWARDAASAEALSRVHRCPVWIGGDLKAAASLPPPLLRWSRPFAVGASTRTGDERRLLSALDQVAPALGCVLAPREPARFDRVAAELAGRRWVRRSALADRVVPADVDVVLLDTLGELPGALVGAAAAFVGGTYDPAIGGHAPWEAAVAGVPVVAGPHRASQGDAFERVGAICGDDLATALALALSRPPPAPPPPPAVGAAVAAMRGPPAPERSPRPALAPLAAGYRALSATRNALYDRGWLGAERIGVPVVSIGSTNARSPGRTTTVRAVAAALAARGHHVGVAGRGYRRAGAGRGVRGSWDDPGAAALGDEAALLASAGFTVATGPDRVAVARALVDRGVTVVVLDDGLQHRRLHRDLDVAVIDARFPEARGLLPAGERREPEPAPARAHLVLVHHGGDPWTAPGHPVLRAPGPWIRGDGRSGPIVGPVAAFAGIGRPADFLASLEIPVARFLALPDHQQFDVATVERVLAWSGGLPLVCTAKDAVRLPDPLRRRAAWRDVTLVLPDAIFCHLKRFDR